MDGWMDVVCMKLAFTVDVVLTCSHYAC